MTYLSGRSTSLAAFFALASIVAWLRAEDDAPAARRWRMLSLGCFVTALACKEYVAVVPIVLLLCAAARAPAGSAEWRSAWRRAAPHALVVLAAAGAAALLPRYRFLLETSLATREIGANLAAQAHGVTYLVGQMLWPAALNADPALPATVVLDVSTIARSGAIVVALAIGLALLRRRHVLGFALLWFFVWLAPTNSLLARLDVANDRQLYLALVGPAWALAWALVHGCGLRARTWVPRRCALVLVGATAVRQRVYADEVVFWADVAAKAPHNARAFANLGHALTLAERPHDAQRAFEVALQLDPGQLQAAANLLLLTGQNRPVALQESRP